MLRLFYFSQSVPSLSPQDLNDIQAISQVNNSKLHLTGVLAHGGGIFAQILEGPQKIVLRQYLKITEDKRHGDCQILQVSPMVDRMFEKWNMAFVEATPIEYQHLAELKLQLLQVVEPVVFRDAMRRFLDVLKGKGTMSEGPSNSS